MPPVHPSEPQREDVSVYMHIRGQVAITQGAYKTPMPLPLGDRSSDIHKMRWPPCPTTKGREETTLLTTLHVRVPTHPSSNYPSAHAGSSDKGHIESIPVDVTTSQKAELTYAHPLPEVFLDQSYISSLDHSLPCVP